MSSRTPINAVLTRVRHFVDWCRNVWRTRPTQAIAVLALVLIVVDFVRPITAVQIALIIVAYVALSPWAERLPSLLERLKSIEWTGVGRFELEQAGKAAAAAGLQVEPTDQKGEPLYKMINNKDPLLVLAGLRIALEMALRDLAHPWGDKLTLDAVFKGLAEGELLTWNQLEVLEDLLHMLQREVHTQQPNTWAAEWALTVGPRLIAALQERAKKRDGPPPGLHFESPPPPPD